MRSLEQLNADDTLAAAAMAATPEATVLVLRALPAVQRVRAEVEAGMLSLEEVVAFVQEVLGGLERGRRLAREGAVCAAAVAVSQVGSDSATALLEGLRSLRLAELPKLALVAGLLVKERTARLTPTTVREAVLVRAWAHRFFEEPPTPTAVASASQGAAKFDQLAMAA